MDKNLLLKITAELDGCTVGQIIKKRFGLSDGIIADLKKTNDGIVLDGKRVFVSERVKEGQVLNVSIHDGVSDIVKRDIPLDILYEDEDIIAINKPRSMPTHPSLNHYDDTLANGLMHYYDGQNFTFRAITRLDRDTSGVVLVAKNPLSAFRLAEQMKSGGIIKEYIAVVNGTPDPLDGRISAPIKRKYESIILRCVSDEGKEAITDYKTVASCDGLSLVSLFPKTGRTHQLRVHMSYIGTPIYGDDLYGAPQRNVATRLHCKKVFFRHPEDGRGIEIEAPSPMDIKELIDYKE